MGEEDFGFGNNDAFGDLTASSGVFDTPPSSDQGSDYGGIYGYDFGNSFTSDFADWNPSDYAPTDPYNPLQDPNSDWWGTVEPGSGLVLRNPEDNNIPEQLMPVDVTPAGGYSNADFNYGPGDLGYSAGQTGGDVYYPWMSSPTGGGTAGGGSPGGAGTTISPKAASGTSSNPLAQVGTDLTKLLGQILGVKLATSLAPNSSALPKTAISPATGNTNGAASVFGTSGNGTVAGVADYINQLTTTQKIAGISAILLVVYLLTRRSSSSPAPVQAQASSPNVVYLPAPRQAVRRTTRRRKAA